MPITAVRDLLQRFSDGYARRDLKAVNEFMQACFITDPHLEVLGTGAVKPGGHEWCRGWEAVRELVASDWEHWGDVTFDVKQAQVSIRGSVAWLATTGMVRDVMTADYVYPAYLEYIKGLLEDDEEMSPQEKMLDIVQHGADIMMGALQGERRAWPFRFTAVAVHQPEGWRFAQAHFSFATTRSPDVRIE